MVDACHRELFAACSIEPRGSGKACQGNQEAVFTGFHLPEPLVSYCVNEAVRTGTVTGSVIDYRAHELGAARPWSPVRTVTEESQGSMATALRRATAWDLLFCFWVIHCTSGLYCHQNHSYIFQKPISSTE